LIKKKRLKNVVFFAFVVFTALFTAFTIAFDRRLLPTVVEIARLRAVTKINETVSVSVGRAVEDGSLRAEDFYIKSVDGNGRIQSLEVNTILIDSLCSRLASEISADLSGIGRESVEVPIGAILGVGGFTNYGPRYSVRIQPLGTAEVDYSSEFSAAGINQINFKIWLDVEAKICIVNPLQTRDVTVSRRVLLVDTVFAGEVPAVYWGTQ